MTHDIPPETLNSNIEYCINEYVRLVAHREMLRDKWFHGKTFEKIAEDYGVTVQTAKNIIYGVGDDILIRASKMRNKPYG